MNIDTKHLRELEVVTRSASAPDAKWLASNNRKLLYSPRGFTVDCSFAPDAAFVLAAVNNLVPLCDEVDSLRAQLAEAKDALAEKDETEGLRAEVERLRKAEAYAQACKRRLQYQIEDAGAENARLRLEIGLLESRQTDEGGQRAVEELRKLRDVLQRLQDRAIANRDSNTSLKTAYWPGYLDAMNHALRHVHESIAAIEAEKPKEAEKVGPDLYDLYANREDCTEGFPDSVTMRRRLDGSEIKYRREAAEKVEPSRKVLVDDILPAAWHSDPETDARIDGRDGDELLRDWLNTRHNPLGDPIEGVVAELVRRALAASKGAR